MATPMKPTIILLIPIFFAPITSLSQDQLTMGVFSVGGSLSYSSSKATYTGMFNDGYTKTQLSTLQPSIYYFVLDRLQIGLSWYYMFDQSRYYLNSGEERGAVMTKRVAYGLGTRYYWPIAEHAVFVGAAFQYRRVLDEFIGRDYLGEIGSDIFLSHSVAVEVTLQYDKSNWDTEQDIDLLAGLGLRYFF